MTPKSFWSYQASGDTPSLAAAIEAHAIAPGTTEAQWFALSPGMRREIVSLVRYQMKRNCIQRQFEASHFAMIARSHARAGLLRSAIEHQQLAAMHAAKAMTILDRLIWPDLRWDDCTPREAFV